MLRSSFAPTDSLTQLSPVQQLPADEDALVQASCIFSDVINLKVKPSGRDEYLASITVRLKPDNVAHPRSLLLELTDESDLFFYHSLLLGEGDFHTLKAEQRLLVDFQSFPAQLVELLRRCMEGDDASPGITASSKMNASGMRMLACLDCTSGGESVFSIVESNQFRELTYIALRLRKGSDEAVKTYLATKLRGYRAESSDLAERLRSSEEAVEQLRRQVDELSAHNRAVIDERTHLEHSLEATHQRELAELKQEHTRAFVELQQSLNEERSRLEAEQRSALSTMTVRAERAEQVNEELQQKGLTLTTTGKNCQDRLDTTEAQLHETQHEVKILREQVKQLELLKFQHERQLGERGVQLMSLQEQLSMKEQLVTNQASQVEQAVVQRKSLEDVLAISKQQCSALEEKFTLSAQEITKGNQIIQKFRADAKQLKAKLRLKTEALSQQEKAIADLGHANENQKHAVEEKDREVSRGKERSERQCQDIEELRKKLADAHEVLKTNQDVIEYLNRQLAERDLKALPPVAGMTTALERDTRGSAVSELLKRTEGLGRALTSTGVRGGLGFPSNATLGSTAGLSELSLGTSVFGHTGLGNTDVLPNSSSNGALLSHSAYPPNLGIGMTSPGGAGTSDSLLAKAGLGVGPKHQDVVGLSPASPSASMAVSKDPLQGPVLYRSPAGNSPIVVK